MKSKLYVLPTVLAMCFFGAAYAHAQEVQPGVARLSLIHGDVSTQRGDSGDWVAGTLNAPVVAGDRVATGTRSRLELLLDYGNILRLDERSEAKIAELTRTHIVVQVSQGTVDYIVFKDNEADVEIDTPNVAIRPLRDGRYRIQVTSDDESEVIVREGEADITTPQGSTQLHKGQLITVRGRDNPEYQIADAPRKDAWDDWNKDRDHQIQDARSWGHANRYYTGLYDLDGHGRWVYVPDYGSVWMPAVAPGWAPYRYGRWVWEPYYGWTWVSYEPWGWAPYHYGRWFVYAGSWCWWPGPIHRAYRPVWAPAYVSFFGFAGRHFAVGVGFGFGSIGWLPIGPSDHFYPWWGGHRRSINVVNITNITNITNVGGVQPIGPLASGSRRAFSNLHGVLNNTHLQNGITTMSADQFGRAAVPRDFRRVTATELRHGQMVAGTVPVVPTRESLRPVDRAVDPATLPPRTNQPERFFTRSRSTFTPEPFHAQAARVEEVLQEHRANMPPGRTGTMSPVSPAMQTAPGNGATMPSVPNTLTRGRDRASTVAAPENPSRVISQAAAPTPQSRGWHRFGGDEAAPTQQSAAPQRPQTQAPSAQRPQPQPPARDNAQPAPGAPRGWQKFSAPDRERNLRSVPSPSQTPSQAQRPSQAAPSERPGWQRFSRTQPQQQQPSSAQPSRSFDQRAPFESSRGYNRPSQPESSRSYSRPPLNLKRPIVTPRAPSGYGASSIGGRGRTSQPSYRGAPSGGSRGSEGGRGSSRPPQGSSGPKRRR